ncbi:MAG: CoA-binding protein [Nanoarchaeota archaeon]|nr:CoA-binding protein [Nanoarchaeota archaeon]MBU1005725.1 CoA-binding protein [Nanoarchaeota archaeon]MBU1945590.1 CoA-binding protein [Nanoarchaeota archaeon]
MRIDRELTKAREILGISENSKVEDVKTRYKGLAKKWHPDLNNSESAHNKMQDINKAYETIMKQEFGIIDPWKDYTSWWFKQYGNDPCWGNPSAEDFGKTRKYGGIKSKRPNLEITGFNAGKRAPNEFLDKSNIFAVIGVSKNPKKYGHKIYSELKFAGYKVYPVNPRIERIEEDKCYPSLSELPNLPDVVDLVVPPDIAEKVVKEAIKLGIKKIWLQPGSESKKSIELCKKNDIQVLHDVCIMIERRKID